MKKTELIEAMAAASGESQASAARALDALIEVVSREVAAGGEVAITGFGSFKVADRSERTGRNPRTGEAMTIAASRSVKFVPGATLKAAVAGGAAAPQQPQHEQQDQPAA
jgi:DNA-binding protein HU-beta